MSQNILIVWHIPSYGIGYFKNVLSAFYTKKIILNQKEVVEGLSQLELEKGFSISDGFLFDKVYYLYFSDETSGKISDRTKSDYVTGRAKVELVNDDIIKQTKTLKIWEEVSKMNLKTIKEELDFVKNKYPKKYDLFSSQYWRNIHYYPIDQQIEWFKLLSNASPIYGKNRVEFINFTTLFDVKDLRDEDLLSSSVSNFLIKNKLVQSKSKFFLNTGLGTLEMQLAFRNIASDSRFNNIDISTFSIVDQKENTKLNYRFRDLKYTFKNSHKLPTSTSPAVHPINPKKYMEVAVYPNMIVQIKFEEIAFITTCHSDSSNNDRYLQKIDGKYFRITKLKLDEIEKLLPDDHFCRINKSTIISNYNGNIQGWSPNNEEVLLTALYVKNEGQFLGTKKSEEEYSKILGKPVSFIIGHQYKETFMTWKKII